MNSTANKKAAPPHAACQQSIQCGLIGDCDRTESLRKAAVVVAQCRSAGPLSEVSARAVWVRQAAREPARCCGDAGHGSGDEWEQRRGGRPAPPRRPPPSSQCKDSPECVGGDDTAGVWRSAARRRVRRRRRGSGGGDGGGDGADIDPPRPRAASVGTPPAPPPSRRRRHGGVCGGARRRGRGRGGGGPVAGRLTHPHILRFSLFVFVRPVSCLFCVRLFPFPEECVCMVA